MISERGKEAVVALHQKGDFFGEGCLTGIALFYAHEFHSETRRSGGRGAGFDFRGQKSPDNEFRDACKKAGVPGSAHGVRKLAATRMANNGATEAQLMAVFGWTDLKMAAHYTRTANRKRLAAQSIDKLNASGTSIPAPEHPVREKEQKAK